MFTAISRLYNASRSLRPATVYKTTLRELKQHCRTAERGNVYVPNTCDLQFGTDDFHRFSSRRFIEDLYVYLEKSLITADVFMDGRLRIRLHEEPAFEPGSYDITASFDDPAPTVAVSNDLGDTSTLVLKKSAYTLPLNLPPNRRFAVLRVVDGADRDGYVEFGERRIYLGRREQNDLMLTDENVSRLHAYVAYERHRHVLTDAGSRNGTFVNGEPVTAVILRVGDYIQVGATTLKYGVM